MYVHHVPGAGPAETQEVGQFLQLLRKIVLDLENLLFQEKLDRLCVTVHNLLEDIESPLLERLITVGTGRHLDGSFPAKPIERETLPLVHPPVAVDA